MHEQLGKQIIVAVRERRKVGEQRMKERKSLGFEFKVQLDEVPLIHGPFVYSY